MKSLGQIAYEAYFKYSGGISLISGSTLPIWEGQPAKIQAAWEAAGDAVTAALLHDHIPPKKPVEFAG